jgi:hypothetical protein
MYIHTVRSSWQHLDADCCSVICAKAAVMQGTATIEILYVELRVRLYIWGVVGCENKQRRMKRHTGRVFCHDNRSSATGFGDTPAVEDG